VGRGRVNENRERNQSLIILSNITRANERCWRAPPRALSPVLTGLAAERVCPCSSRSHR
jgi:hypothetical protein